MSKSEFILNEPEAAKFTKTLMFLYESTTTGKFNWQNIKRENSQLFYFVTNSLTIVFLFLDFIWKSVLLITVLGLFFRSFRQIWVIYFRE